MRLKYGLPESITYIMSYFEDKHLDFVLKHYQEGKFDTQKAIRRFNEAHGIRPKPRRNVFVMFSGIAAAAAIMLGVFLFHNAGQNRWTEFSTLASAQEFTLPDNSIVTLSPFSTLRYRQDEVREVEMTGKVFFDVMRDETRPFEIKADGAFVRVLGTEFQIDDGSQDGTETVNVYVADGKVLFAKNSRSEGLVLVKGMGASLKEGEEKPVADENPDINSIAWQRGSFIFDQTPLKEVLDCLSEYYEVSFAASGLDRRLSGEFYNDDLDLIISLIESALDVTIIKK